MIAKIISVVLAAPGYPHRSSNYYPDAQKLQPKLVSTNIDLEELKVDPSSR
jgi:hypothetical protein